MTGTSGRGRPEPRGSSGAAEGTQPDPADRVRAIQLPEEIAQGLEERIRGSGFPSIDAFVAFVLARLLENPSEVPFSEDEERRLKERLRSLGYID